MLPVAVRLVLPQYTPGILAAQVLVLGSSYIVLRYSTSFFFAALSKLYRTFPLQILAILCAIAVSALSLTMGAGLAGVALGTASAHLVASLGLLSYAYRHYDRNIRSLIGFLLGVHLPTVYGAGAVAALELLLPDPAPSASAMSILALKLLLYVGLCIPLLIEVNRTVVVLPGVNRWLHIRAGAR
jgi:hypothetical protein